MAELAPYGQDRTSYQTGEVDVHMAFTCTTDGAVPTAASAITADAGISCVLSGTGVYTFTTTQRYARFLGCKIRDVMQASYSASGACELKITAFDLSAGTVTLTAVTAAGAAVTPAIGDKIFVCLAFSIYAGQV